MVVQPFAKASRVNVGVFDVAGRLVRRLAEGPTPAGEHEVRWDVLDSNGGHAAAGLYLVRVTTEHRAAEQKVIVVK